MAPIIRSYSNAPLGSRTQAFVSIDLLAAYKRTIRGDGFINWARQYPNPLWANRWQLLQAVLNGRERFVEPCRDVFQTSDGRSQPISHNRSRALREMPKSLYYSSAWLCEIFARHPSADHVSRALHVRPLGHLCVATR